MAFLPAIAAALPSLATVGQVAGLAGTALSAFAAVRQGQGVEAQNQAAAQAAEFNAQSQEVAAASELQVAEADAKDKRRRASAARASSIADRGASGVAFAGAPLLVDEDLVGALELDALRSGHAGEVKANAHRNRADLFRAQAVGDRAEGKNQKRAGLIKAGTTLLGGLAGFAQQRFG